MRIEKKLVFVFAAVSALGVSAGTVFVREKAGHNWQDGLFVGGGRTGALAYAPTGLEWTINRNDVFDSRVWKCDYLTHDEVMKCVATNEGKSVAFLSPVERPRTKSYPDCGDKLTLSLSAARLNVRFWPGLGWSMPSIPPVRQELDTRTGELRSSLFSPKMTPEAITVIERARDVMAVDLRDPSSPSRSAVIELTRPEDVRMNDLPFAWREVDGAVVFTQKLPGGETYAVAMSAAAKPKFIGRTAIVRTTCGRTVFLAVRTTNDAADPAAAALAAVKRAEKDGFEAVRAENRAWWNDFWQKGARAYFTGDDKLDTLWNYALYALAGQFGGSPMPALNGLAYGPLDAANGGVGHNCYVHDQNVQIPMMPFFPLGHADFITPFVKTYERGMTELERRTKEYFKAEGAYLPLNMNQNCVEHPIADYRYTLCGGAYSGLVLAQAWWYTQDEKILREIYPLLKKFILFYTSTMTRDADGVYHFIWSVPPEIFTGTIDETSIVACLKPCLETAIEAAERFKCDAKEAALWKDILANYPKVAKHSTGSWWCGPEIPDDHYMYGGHLFYPFFPAESDVDVEMAKKTLDYHRDYAVEVSYETNEPHPVHEWSALYSGMAKMRVYGGERGWKVVKDFQNWFAKPNGFFSHNPIIVTDLTPEQIRANMAKAPKLIRRNYQNRMVPYPRIGPGDLAYSDDCKALVAPVLEGGAAFLLLASESLCQSWGGEIRIFPAVPKGFSGRFENFRVRGGHTVSAEMRNGKVVDFDIRTVGENVKVKISCPTDPDFVQLPGEPAWKKPVGCGPFPDALSAFVFRNWTLVPAETLARTVGAEVSDIKRIAAEMGLDPEAAVPAEWKESGYVTILRRNWQLLPYSQILSVSGLTRRELRHRLSNDDFLMGKLGSVKPAAERIVYSRELERSGSGARCRLRRTLEGEGAAISDKTEEPRFEFMRALAEVPESAAGGDGEKDARFRRRLIFPYCADYGDVLADPDAASCSEGLIARLAERGVNALWFHTVLSTLSTDPKYPEWGADAVRRRDALKKLVARARKYGVKVFLYINEPRMQPRAFFDVPGREGMRGVDDPKELGYNAMCIEDPAPLKWLEGCLKDLFTDVPGLGGVFTITMSETMTHCASHFKKVQEKCPKCKGKPYEYFITKVNEAVVRGVKGASPKAEVWFFDVGWEVEGTDRKVISKLPKDASLILWSEKYLPFSQAGRMHKVTEYSISHPGPAKRAIEMWNMAKEAGLGCVAKLQVSCSWEISSVPYLPAMDLVAQHACNLAATPVDSVMLSWSLGGYPSPNLALFGDLRKNDTVDDILGRTAEKLYGRDAAGAVRSAWSAYSEAFSEYPIEWQTVYYSPVQMGPANLLYLKKSGWPATMVNTPYDDFTRWTAGYSDNRKGWIEQMRKVWTGFENADRLWKDAVGKMSGAAAVAGRRDAVVFRAATLHFRTCVDQAEFILARDRGDRAAMKKYAERELETAREMLALVRADSRLGYETSNRYIYVPNDFLEKILNCRQVIDALR
jgi:hypothetical protein